MPTNDGFDLRHHTPLIHADQAEQQDIGDAYQGAVASPRLLKGSVLIAIATAAGIAALFIADPVALLANVTASLVGNSAPQPGIEQPAPAIQPAAEAPALTQSVADAQDMAPAAKDTPSSDEVAASEPAATADQTETSQDQAEKKSEPPPDVLFRQFQAWAADQDAQANLKPPQPVQDAPAQLAQDAPAHVVEHAHVLHRPMLRHRQVRAVRHANARAEMATQNSRRARRMENARAENARESARAERLPVRDARAQEQPVQNSQVPSFLSGFGQRN